MTRTKDTGTHLSLQESIFSMGTPDNSNPIQVSRFSIAWPSTSEQNGSSIYERRNGYSLSLCLSFSHLLSPSPLPSSLSLSPLSLPSSLYVSPSLTFPSPFFPYSLPLLPPSLPLPLSRTSTNSLCRGATGVSVRYSSNTPTAEKPYRLRAEGPLHATLTIPSSSSSVGKGTSSETLAVSGGTGDCHGRVNGERDPCIIDY